MKSLYFSRSTLYFLLWDFFLHLLGIVLILISETKKYLHTMKYSNQNILLLHLSIVSIISLFTNSIAVYNKTMKIRFPDYFIMIYYISYITYIINLLYLSLDRLFFVFFPLRYRTIVSKLMIGVALLICWALGISYGFMMKYAKFINHGDYNRYASFVYNGALVFFTIIIYAAIIYKIHVSGKNLGNQKQENDTKNKMKKKVNIRKYLVPFLIVFTFFLFNIIPAIITSEASYGRAAIIGLIGLNILNHVTDPMIYIFIQPSIRKRLHMLLKRSNLKYSMSKGGSTDSKGGSTDSDVRQKNKVETINLEESIHKEWRKRFKEVKLFSILYKLKFDSKSCEIIFYNFIRQVITELQWLWFTRSILAVFSKVIKKTSRYKTRTIWGIIKIVSNDQLEN